jgi:hypothetical protein
MTKKTSLLLLLVASFFATNANAEKSGSLNRNSVAIQFGLNGTIQSSDNWGLQMLPPDLSYAYEFFDNNNLNISTATFYDNIGVEIKDTNFSYRVGQRVDFALEFQKFTAYSTFGLASIRYGHKYQTSPVYGVGFLKYLMPHILSVYELNFQNVKYQNARYDIVNFSIGLVYNF